MNAEKELLLALLIEKYTANTTITVFTGAQSKVPTSKRRHVVRRHYWTKQEKSYLLQARIEGVSWDMISRALQLSSKQVQSMHYTLTQRKAVQL